MNYKTNTVDVWDNEYSEVQSIPSSTRTLPSKALCILAPLIDFPNIAQVLDAGCGNGRNSIYLAKHGCKVTAVDFSKTAIETAKAAADRNSVRQNIALEQLDLLQPLPYESERYDLCLDSYVSCHFLDKKTFNSYWEELSRVTRPGGLIFSSMFCGDDEFYARLKSPAFGHAQATDPANSITKVLYSEDQFKLLFSPPLAIKYFLKFQFTDTVLHNQYLRSLLVAVLEKAK
jgi:SAM-dependent methyltransferase